MSFIKGNFKKYIFKSDSGYIIGLFRVKDCSDDITFTGYFPLLNETDLYVFNGNMVNHTKYGEQFNVVSYEVILPNEKDNVVDFLCSDIFPGIGEKKASKIVEVLGDDCLSVILECPSNLMLVPGVTEKQKNTISIRQRLFLYLVLILISLLMILMILLIVKLKRFVIILIYLMMIKIELKLRLSMFLIMFLFLMVVLICYMKRFYFLLRSY